MNLFINRGGRLLTVIVLTSAAVSVARAADSVAFEVRAGEHDREGTPLALTLPAEFARAKAVWMQRLDRGTIVPVQLVTSDPPQIVWMLQDRLPARTSRAYRVSVTAIGRPQETPVTCVDDGRALTVNVRGAPVQSYHTVVVEPPRGADPIYRRSGFIHPLRSPSGKVLTEAFPADHLHQHGVFFAWVKTEFDGRPIDFWNQADRTGIVEHEEVTQLVSGPVFAGFTVRLKHVDISAQPAPVPALNETWSVRVYNRADAFLIDIESQQACAGELPLVLQEYHYGGMALRGNSKWLGEDGSEFLTSEGKSRADGNHTRPHWTDLSGILDGRPCGVAVLQHPSNPRFPAPVRLHPSKPYFVFSPVVLGDLTITPEQPLVSRYRFVTHDGRPDADALQAAWRDYAEPPEVRIIE